MSPKRKKMIRRSRVGISSKRNSARDLPPVPTTGFHGNTLILGMGYGLAVFLIFWGQWLLFKSPTPFSYLPSILGVVLGFATYQGWLDDIKLPNLPARKMETPVSAKAAPARVPQKRAVPTLSVPSVPVVASRITPSGLVRAMLLVFALFLGAMGQFYLRDNGRILSQGLWYYFWGVLLFLLVLWPWKREQLSKRSLPFSIEMGAFGLIMVLAAFLRIYKLDTIPSGVFFDMGFQGLAALKVWREMWFPWELNITEGFPSAPIPIYLGSLWFLFFPNTQFCLNLFYVTFCLASFPLIYWTFRQLAGPRVALLTLYILAVMRWNMNFARNSFPPSLLPFFMFGCLGLFLYGMRTGKKWAFVVSAISAALGLYAYQTHVVFPLLVVLLMMYEIVSNWEGFRQRIGHVLIFWLTFTVVSSFYFFPLFMGKNSDRARSLSIMNRIKIEHSIRPLVVNTQYTALMFNRRGDPNSRHNLQDHRQLDDVTGMLFFFGVFYALFRFWRKKYFWGLSGAFIMALPCLLTIDPAHSSRMHGMTAFVAFLAAATLAAIWGRIASIAGALGEVIWVLILALPLTFMAYQNYNVYFKVMPLNMGCWGEYSIAESTLGRKCAEWGKQGDALLVSPRFWCHYTVDYFTYFVRKQTQRMTMPEALAPKRVDPKGGYFFTMEQGRTGMQKSLQWAYPGGLASEELNPSGVPFIHFYRVLPEVVGSMAGLKATYSNQGAQAVAAPLFPKGLPPGPYHARFEGVWFAGGTARYGFPESSTTWTVAGRTMGPGEKLHLAKGFYKVVIDWDAPAGATEVPIKVSRDGEPYQMDPENFSRAPLNHGVLAEFYDNPAFRGRPGVRQWEPCVNYINGNDFSFSHPNLAAKWKGTLRCPTTGQYRFYGVGCGSIGEVWVDGVAAWKEGMTHSLELTRGSHEIEIRFPRPSGMAMAFSLMWLKPGDANQEVVSMEYFGETQPLSFED